MVLVPAPAPPATGLTPASGRRSTTAALPLPAVDPLPVPLPCLLLLLANIVAAPSFLVSLSLRKSDDTRRRAGARPHDQYFQYRLPPPPPPPPPPLPPLRR